MIGDLVKDPRFRAELEAIAAKHRPFVKAYDPKNPNAVEEWKYDCARQHGFDILYRILLGPKT